MSVYFIADDRRGLWNPASDTARLFHDQCTSVARMLGVESGLAPIISDEVIVDAETWWSSRRIESRRGEVRPFPVPGVVLVSTVCDDPRMRETRSAPSNSSRYLAACCSEPPLDQ
jgi:hypothetical protein